MRACSITCYDQTTESVSTSATAVGLKTKQYRVATHLVDIIAEDTPQYDVQDKFLEQYENNKDYHVMYCAGHPKNDGVRLRSHTIINPGPAGSVPPGFTAPSMASWYNFPAIPPMSANQVNVAVISEGGAFTQEDMDLYFNICFPPPNTRTPPIVQFTTYPDYDVFGTGAFGTFGQTPADDNENALDTQLLAGICPQITNFYVFVTDGSVQSVNSAVAAIFQKFNYGPGIVSMSLGVYESGIITDDVVALNQTLNTGVNSGVVFCVSSGDLGCFPNPVNPYFGVDYPGCSPYVICVGGTSLVYENVSNPPAAANVETVWGSSVSIGNTGAGSGGGQSYYTRYNQQPPFQSNIYPLTTYRQPNNYYPSGVYPGLPSRFVPDVAFNADPASGYLTVVNGISIVQGGTSASTPIFAGFLALIRCISRNQKVARGYNDLGFGHYLYTAPSNCFNYVQYGTNGWPATSALSEFVADATGLPKFYNMSCGLGTINGTNMYNYLDQLT